MRRSITDL
jgi:hypothetical protein